MINASFQPAHCPMGALCCLGNIKCVPSDCTVISYFIRVHCGQLSQTLLGKGDQDDLPEMDQLVKLRGPWAVSAGSGAAGFLHSGQPDDNIIFIREPGGIMDFADPDIPEGLPGIKGTAAADAPNGDPVLADGVFPVLHDQIGHG